MIVRRLAWGAWLITSASLYVFSGSKGALSVLILSLAYALTAPFLGWLPRRKAVLKLTASEDLSCRICVDGGSFRLCSVEYSISVKNLLTGESSNRILYGSGGKAVDFALKASRCGMLEISVNEVRVSDPLRLTVRKLPVSAHVRRLCSPNLFDPGVLPERGTGIAVDSGAHFHVIPGSDPGEMASLRDYLPGDSLNSIHWKLSEKNEKLLVRELAQPAESRVMIAIIEPQPGPAIAAEMAELLFSLSMTFLESGHRHVIGWYDDKLSTDQRMDICSRDDFERACEEVLSCPAGNTNISVDEIMNFTRVFAICNSLPGGDLPENVAVLSVQSKSA